MERSAKKESQCKLTGKLENAKARRALLFTDNTETNIENAETNSKNANTDTQADFKLLGTETTGATKTQLLNMESTEAKTENTEAKTENAEAKTENSEAKTAMETASEALITETEDAETKIETETASETLIAETEDSKAENTANTEIERENTQPKSLYPVAMSVLGGLLSLSHSLCLLLTRARTHKYTHKLTHTVSHTHSLTLCVWVRARVCPGAAVFAAAVAQQMTLSTGE
jgi:hypothetical protein